LQTLEHWAQAGEQSDSEEARKLAAEARAFLRETAAGIELGRRGQPEGVNLDEMRAQAADRIAGLMSALGK
jgi:hypothetical protein